MDKIQLIKAAIDKAEKEQSKLTETCFKIGGFTSPKIRHLLNNLGEIGKNYLEIGVHRGSTFYSAMYANDMNGIAVDNWTEFNDGTVRDEFIGNIKEFTDNGKAKFYEQDCFTIPVDEINHIDFYLYDGNHSYESQKEAITYFYPSLADEFILCVDDTNWEQVILGTKSGIKAMGLTILFEQQFTEGYHNGFYVALLKK